ncbi:DUF4232 domain-containing protein [Streptomyces marincola]|uniref:DUF4232 domain-containing protein n=1 Tax=Streptomyces marincola TaxID=2878388 RepID=UPI001CF2469C|nr:DUF4232 domain-containing protein [Streptomyces marincola]UCM88923.1 DUF4232 domain-containing protein [Streptomyces marincola]
MSDHEPGRRPPGGPADTPPGDPARTPPGDPAGTAAPRQAAGVLDEEEHLRALLRDAVDGIEPSSDSLAHLREAVPARRRRKRHLLLGTAASVALLGFGAPMVVTATVGADRGGGDQARDVRGSLPYDGEDGEGHPPGDAAGYGAPGGHPVRPGESAEGGADPVRPEDGAGGGHSAAPSDPEVTMGVTSPVCDRRQLGRAETHLEPPDAQGRVYGLIRLANVSDQPCRVRGNGELAALPLGSGGGADVQIVDRTEGDRATGLPAPDESREELVLPPGRAYQIQFAWVPTSPGTGTCAVDGGERTARPGGEGTAGPSAAPTDAGGTSPSGFAPMSGDAATTAPATDPVNGGEPDGGAPDGGADGSTGDGSGGNGGGAPGPKPTAPDTSGPSDPDGPGGPTDEPTEEERPGSEVPGGGAPGADGDAGGDSGVLLRYTPDAGEPAAAQIRMEGTCSGTVYRTGVLQAPNA